MQLPADSASVHARNALFIALGIVTFAFLVVFFRAWARKRREGQAGDGGIATGLTGFAANFFDTLGIGSFATSTTVFRHFKLLRDEQIPGTLNVGYALPTIAEAFIYTKLIPVETTTLIIMIAAAVLGGWLGAGVVCSWPKRRIQLGMGAALLGAAIIMFMSQPQIGLVPVGGNALGLTGVRLVLGIIGNFALGAFMMIGIGLYAPCMILVSLLGLNATTAFPIMMGSCAFLMPFASTRFVRKGSYAPNAALWMMLAGVPGVLIAAFIVKSLPLTAVKWLVVVVVTYAAVNLLRAGMAKRTEIAMEPAGD
jgi:uncharacterized membrane protein YfcA